MAAFIGKAHCSMGLGFRVEISKEARSVSKLGVPLLGVPIKRIIVFWGLYWGLPILGNCKMCLATSTEWGVGGLGALYEVPREPNIA